MQRYCTFWVGSHFLGIEVEKVQEVLKFSEITPVPLSPPAVRGLINLRGRIVTVIDLRRRFGVQKNDTTSTNQMHIILYDDQDSLSLMVDRSGDVVEVGEETYEELPDTLQGEARRLIRGAFKLKEQLMLVVDVDHAINFQAENDNSR
ncbi:MAG: chemotaxis protein CheW [Thermoanaerobaculales bacterium]|nr:chemotaxis protein CheW [Thermoanaerobaculales bacterium]